MAEVDNETLKKASGEKVEEAFKQYTESMNSAVKSMRTAKDSLDSVKEAVEDSNAETSAAEETAEQGPISFSEALELMNEEQAAKRKYNKAATEYVKKAGEGFAEIISSGTKMIALQTDDLLDSFGEKAFSGSGLAMMGIGAAAALLPNAIREPAEQMVGNYLGLKDNNEIDENTEEKYVDGYENPENAAKSAIEDNNQAGDGSSADKQTTGKDAETDNEFTAAESYDNGLGEDALNMTDEAMSKIADLNKLLGEDSEGLENSGETFIDVIGENVEAAVEGNTAKAVTQTVSKLWSELDDAANGKGDGGEKADEIDLDITD